MAAKNKIEFRSAGFRAILTGSGTRRVVEAAAMTIQQKAGPGFRYAMKLGSYGGGRWIAYVRGNALGNRREATEKALSRAVSA